MTTDALKITGLKKTYANGVEALKSVDLSVAAGDFFALLGPNGAGKSTLIGIVSSLVNKTAGQIEIFGHNLATDIFAAKSQLGVVPQEFNCNGFEKVVNVLTTQAGYYGVHRDAALNHAQIYLKELGLWEKRDHIVRSLSGGMKRRLMIARALVHGPRLLILDEPSAGVDIEIRRSMWAFLKELNASGLTIILTTHYLEEAESLCRNIAIINRGEIVENTSMRLLLKQMDTETLVLYLHQPLTQLLPTGKYVIRQIDDLTLEADLSSQENLNDLFNWLSQYQIEIKSMRNKSNRLEQLFVSKVLSQTPMPTVSKVSP